MAYPGPSLAGGRYINVYRRRIISGGPEFMENPLENGDSGGSLPKNCLNVGIYCGF